ncbi:hypothetical protein CLV27_1399 [Phorcysia thermohydrogeniphila]|uniref:Uncharacterized protein n=2 Tax=Phorcysia thermohydrogeniphila TaxID=936138 RepID=A0A4R1G745_9BACT|nr:hypothetical protein CLV27_1399 [Phorcysia thermohydrogeniphila]
MQVKSAVTSVFFEAEELRQELVVDALLFFAEKLKKLSLKPDAIYPGDSFALPFAMFLSNKLSVPIKTEKFLSGKETVLVVFSYLSGSEVTEEYIREKVVLLRKKYPLSPTLIVASSKSLSIVDFQLLKVRNLERVNSYRFLMEAKKNFFYPIEGEFTHYTSTFWELSKQEIKAFERAKRIRDNAKKYLREEKQELKILDTEPELAIWERFCKGLLVYPGKVEEESKEELPLKPEKLIQVDDKRITSAVTSLLEYISQSLEYYFPVQLAYSSLEIAEHEGILMIPRVSEVMGGADLRLEIVLKSGRLETNFKKLLSLVKDTIRALFTEIFEKEVFRPSIDSVIDKELSKATLYLNWFLDREMIEILYRKINRRWLLSRLLYRKRLKSSLKELLKNLREFEFTPENLEHLFASLESLWKRSPALLKFYGREIKGILDKRELWSIVGVYGIKVWNSRSKVKGELLSFLLSLKGYENIHQFLAKENRYFVPVVTKRIYRPNWERVIRGGLEISLKAEPLNPESPVTYVLLSQEGHFLGTIPEIVSHYIAAKESSGKKIECKKLYFDPDVFSENSYWVEVRCL